ncbi:MAG: DUF4474 domain-containing protein [Deltaproteobacteria bacterium]|nr:DUF4474 domain-containing protein [Deltaproteobacteria bacterium]
MVDDISYGWQPTTPLGRAVYEAGFEYLAAQDILVSRMNPRQRKFGYAWAYDRAAPFLHMIIHCEPFYFDFDGKHWMLEVWKGQYGFEAGAEIGVYNRKSNSLNPKFPILDALIGHRPDDHAHDRYYPCAEDADRLEMGFTLRRGSAVLFERPRQRHWWCTGFRWGVFAEPSELSLDVRIRTARTGLRNAIVAAVRARNYPVTVSGTEIRFTFTNPTTIQPTRMNPELTANQQDDNRRVVQLYAAQHFANNDPNNVRLSGELADLVNGRLTGRSTLAARIRAMEQAGMSGLAKLVDLLT